MLTSLRRTAVPKSNLRGRATIIPHLVLPSGCVPPPLITIISNLVLDYAAYYLSYEASRMSALVLLGSSYVIHTYQVRPFSNSIESVLLAISLLLLRKLLVTESITASRKV